VDFLSKYVIYKDGQYLIFRPAVETHARLIMPEEMNPGKRDRPDPIIAAERAMGHLLDNPFCLSVRTVCMDLLTRLNSHYGVGRIEITPEMKRSYPWKGFGDLPQYLPLCPSVSFIENLYGVGPVSLSVSWPEAPSFDCFDWNDVDRDCESFYSNIFYALTVVKRFKTVGYKRLRSFVKMISPFKVPSHVYGTHAGRLESVICHFGLTASNALDLGAHPGACAMSLLKVVDDLTCVSLKPDDGSEFCNYIFRDARSKVIQMDADIYEPDCVYDLVHDDVDIVGARTQFDDARLAHETIKRATRYYPYAKTYIFTIRDINPSILLELYELYKLYGRFDIVKAHYSNPWRLEFVVVVRRSGGNRRRRHNFMGSMNAFLNKQGRKINAWAFLVSEKIYQFKLNGVVDECPYRSDDVYQKQLSDTYTISR
jgi:hypothetical protein